VTVGTGGQGEEEAHLAPEHHSAPEGPWPPWRRHHRGLLLKAGGAADGARAPAVWDGGESAAGGHGTRLRHAPEFGDPAAHSGGAGGARRDLTGQGSPADAA
jgi:hypothetical protein